MSVYRKVANEMIPHLSYSLTKKHINFYHPAAIVTHLRNFVAQQMSFECVLPSDNQRCFDDYDSENVQDSIQVIYNEINTTLIVSFSEFIITLNNKQVVLKKPDGEVSYIMAEKNIVSFQDEDYEYQLKISDKSVKILRDDKRIVYFAVTQKFGENSHVKFQVQNLHYNSTSADIRIIEQGELSLIIDPDYSYETFTCNIFHYPGDYRRDHKCVYFSPSYDDYCIDAYVYVSTKVCLTDRPAQLRNVKSIPVQSQNPIQANC